jgi:hypothetical protein
MDETTNATDPVMDPQAPVVEGEMENNPSQEEATS